MIDLQSFQGFTPGRWGKMLFSERVGIPVYRVWRGNLQGGPFAVVAGDIRREPDAELIAAAPDILARALELEAENACLRQEVRGLRARLGLALIGTPMGEDK